MADRDETVNMNLRSGGGWAQLGADSLEMSRYRDQLRDPGSFASGLLAVPTKLASMKAAAAAGNMEAAKGFYDEISDFYASHGGELVDVATAPSSGRNPLLARMQSAAAIGMERGFDNVMMATPRGQLSVAQLFGPDGEYKSMMRDELRRTAGFSDEVAAAMTGGGDMAKLMDVITAGALKTTRETGQPPADASQRAQLAHYVATHGDDLEDLGFGAVNALVNYIVTSPRMGDGTSLGFYKEGVEQLRARRPVYEDERWDGVGDAGEFIRSREALDRSVAGGQGGVLSGAARRGMSAITSAVLSVHPDIDFDDEGVRAGIADVAEIFAQGERVGVKFLPLVTNRGSKLSRSIADYVLARAEGAEVPEDNLIFRLRDAHSMLGQILAPDWDPDPVKSRGNPDEKAGLAAGLFGRSSGFQGLDSASVAAYRVLAPAVTRALCTSRSDGTPASAVDALRSALADEPTRGSLARALSSAMALPPEASAVLATHLTGLAFDANGLLRPRGLERTVFDLAYGFHSDPAARAAAPMLGAWHARNVGSAAASYDRLLDGVDTVLLDDVLGAGEDFRDAASRRAFVDAMKQKIKSEMHEDALNGLSPRLKASEYKNRGRFYQVTGWRGADGKVHEGLPSAKDVKAGATPVIQSGYGRLDAVGQDLGRDAGPWVIPGTNTAVPSFSAGLWSANPRLFIAYMRQLRDLARGQAKVAAGTAGKIEQSDGL